MRGHSSCHRRHGGRDVGAASGFTLVELLVVMAVLGILAMMIMPLAELNVQREREGELRQALWQIREAIDAYKKAVDAGQVVAPAGSSGYPPTLQMLVQGTASVAGSAPAYFLRRIPRDPFADPALAAPDTWGLRSYASPPDDPHPGADVYDVYSRAAGKGLNGVPLHDW